MKPDFYEQETERQIKTAKAFRHVKESKAPVCPDCGMFLTAKIKQGGIEWHCGGTLNVCHYTLWEFTE